MSRREKPLRPIREPWKSQVFGRGQRLHKHGNVLIVKCRGLLQEVIDFGARPLANDFRQKTSEAKTFYWLALSICKDCDLYQLAHTVPPDTLFKDYPYRSGMRFAGS